MARHFFRKAVRGHPPTSRDSVDNGKVADTSNVNPGLNKPLDCLIGRVPFKYQIMTIGGVPP